MRGGVGGITVHLSSQGGQVAECRKRLEVIFDSHIIKRVGRLYIYERWGWRHHCASVWPGLTGG